MDTRRFLAAWLPIAIAGTVVFATAYAAGQQMLRQSANDPVVEFAHNAASYLSQGVSPQVLFSTLSKVDMATSRSIFAMSFDQQGALTASNAVIGSSLDPAAKQPSVPPAGVFAYASAHGEDRVTWQTADGLRFAADIVPWKVDAAVAPKTALGTTTSGYFLAARSLAPTEAHISELGLIMLAGWLAFIIATVLAVWAGASLSRSRP